MAPPKPPLTPAEKRRIRAMHDAGETRNAIAKALGRSASTVSKYCEAQGLVFPHPQKEQAVKALELSVRARKVAAHDRSLEILELAQAQLLRSLRGEQKFKAKLKGTGGAEHVEELDFIPSDEFRNLQSALTSATTAIKNLAPVGDEDKEQAVSMAEQLAAQLGLPVREADQ